MKVEVAEKRTKNIKLGDVVELRNRQGEVIGYYLVSVRDNEYYLISFEGNCFHGRTSSLKKLQESLKGLDYEVYPAEEYKLFIEPITEEGYDCLIQEAAKAQQLQIKLNSIRFLVENPVPQEELTEKILEILNDENHDGI